MQALWHRFLNIWKTHEDMSGRFVRASFIAVAERFITKGLQFVRTIILARLLFPEDLGLFGLAALSLGLIEVFLQSGFSAALIHEKGNVEKYMHTAWTVQVLRNTLVGSIVFFTAPVFANFFSHPEITPLIQVLALAFFIDGFVNIGAVLFQKELRYNLRFIYNLSFVVTEIIVVIVAAYYLRSPWALVYGVLANRISSVCFSYVLHPFRPHFELDMQVVRHLFRYGKWVSIAAIVSFLIVQGDNLFIGRMLGAEQLGYYQPAYALALIPVAEFGRVLGGALFPKFASMNASSMEMKQSFLRVMRLVFSFTAPLCIGLYVLSSEFVPLVYGERWLPMVPIVSVLALYCLVKTYESVTQAFFLGVGVPQVQTHATVFQCVILMSVMGPSVMFFGVTGAAYAVLLSGCVALAYLVWSTKRFLGLRLSELGAILLPIAGSVSGMYGVLLLITQTYHLSHGSMLFLSIGCGAFTYLTLLFLFDSVSGEHLQSDIQWIKQHI